MTTVFVSHSSQDRDFAGGVIVPCLRQSGCHTWYSRHDLRTADDWQQAILGALRSCDYCLVVLSSHAAASPWARAEVDWAVTNRPGKIVPVLRETCNLEEVHLQLPLLQLVDFRRDAESGVARLLAALALPASAGQRLATAQAYASPPYPTQATNSPVGQAGVTPPAPPLTPQELKLAARRALESLAREVISLEQHVTDFGYDVGYDPDSDPDRDEHGRLRDLEDDYSDLVEQFRRDWGESYDPYLTLRENEERRNNS